jgi:hypothetical protein
MMVAYSFQKRFAEPILAGTKAQTIRADRKRHARPGEEVQLYIGMRTKHCRLLGRSTCVAVEPIMLDFRGSGVIKIGGTVLFSDSRMQEFARSDGFKSWEAMKGFWADVHDVDVFEGILIRWRPLEARA